MTQNEFNVVLEQQYRKCADVLVHKKKEYTGDRIDRLSAFKIAASLQGCTPKTALAGMIVEACRISLVQNPKYCSKDTRVGQLVITPVLIADFVLDLGEARDIGAFGSTGNEVGNKTRGAE